ncbi:iron ABC transporter substrate-binding protein [Verrucomicrobia bacterium IMCC26134]|nr:iron ABC transporter substrate-binding protein [Verrucomicrobia bacterium IMCC26134]
MRRNITLLVFLMAVLALPFWLRTGALSDETKSDRVLVIISPHNEAIRYEFEAGFKKWYFDRTGKTVAFDWRLIGGTSEIARYLEGEYSGSFQNYWTGKLGRPWSTVVASSFADGRLAKDAPLEAKEAREAFLASSVGCGIDLFFGGGSYDFIVQARAGRLVSPGLENVHADWFQDSVFPVKHAGDDFRDPQGRWFGAALSSFGIVYNRDSLARLGMSPPSQWTDLADPRLIGQVALADPTKSGSMNKAFENVLQQQIHRIVDARLATTRFSSEADKLVAEQDAVAEGWVEGLRLLQYISANSRYFTDSAQKVPIDVAAGNCAVGMCIDFYGRQQVEALERRSGSGRMGYVSPQGGTVYSVDPIGLLRGSTNEDTARAFIEYVLSDKGQSLWNQKPGTPGGPTRFALRRLPVRKDAYGEAGLAVLRSDPEEAPYQIEAPLVYRPEWTAALFGELRFIMRVMCLDSQPELVAAWRDIVAAGMPPQAVAIFSDLSAVDYLQSQGRIKAALKAKDKVEELKLAKELGEKFRAQYLRAGELARSGK